MNELLRWTSLAASRLHISQTARMCGPPARRHCVSDPAANGSWFRKSGYKRELIDLADERTRYGAIPKWDVWITKKEKALLDSIAADGFTPSEVQASRRGQCLVHA